MLAIKCFSLAGGRNRKEEEEEVSEMVFFFKVYLNYLNSFMIRKYFHISKIRIHLY